MKTQTLSGTRSTDACGIHPSYRGEISPLKNIGELETDWRALETIADCSFFLSWSWIGSWLELAQHEHELYQYRCYYGDELVSLAIIAAGNVRRRFFFPSKVLTLNEVSDSSLNMFIEHNGVLTKRDHETVVIEKLLNDLLKSRLAYDEIQLSNISKAHYQSLHISPLDLRAEDAVEHAVWALPLDKTTDIESLIGRMSKNRRWQMRRTLKEYDKQGPLHIDAAIDTREALDYFHQMGVLHTQRWERAGKDGSFMQENWVKFHTSLIKMAFDRGEIQILRIRCGERVIGYLYNFLWRDTVHMLQSGFAAEQSNVMRPGYVSHMLAMQFNAQHGARQYDFMTGDADYKRVLAMATPPLISVRLQRPRMKFFIENTLVALYRRVRGRLVLNAGQQSKETIETGMHGLVVAVSLDSLATMIKIIGSHLI